MVGPDLRGELAETTPGDSQASTDKVVVANHDRVATIASLLLGIIRIFRE